MLAIGNIVPAPAEAVVTILQQIVNSVEATVTGLENLSQNFTAGIATMLVKMEEMKTKIDAKVNDIDTRDAEMQAVTNRIAGEAKAEFDILRQQLADKDIEADNLKAKLNQAVQQQLDKQQQQEQIQQQQEQIMIRHQAMLTDASNQKVVERIVQQE